MINPARAVGIIGSTPLAARKSIRSSLPDGIYIASTRENGVRVVHPGRPAVQLKKQAVRQQQPQQGSGHVKKGNCKSLCSSRRRSSWTTSRGWTTSQATRVTEQHWHGGRGGVTLEEGFTFQQRRVGKRALATCRHERQCGPSILTRKTKDRRTRTLSCFLSLSPFVFLSTHTQTPCFHSVAHLSSHVVTNALTLAQVAIKSHNFISHGRGAPIQQLTAR